MTPAGVAHGKVTVPKRAGVREGHDGAVRERVPTQWVEERDGPIACTIRLDDVEVELARRIADARALQETKHDTTVAPARGFDGKPSSWWFNFKGALTEIRFARAMGVQYPRVPTEMRGDRGIDFVLDGYTIQVKTSVLNQRALGFDCDHYQIMTRDWPLVAGILVQGWESPRNDHVGGLIGWAWKQDMAGWISGPTRPPAKQKFKPAYWYPRFALQPMRTLGEWWRERYPDALMEV